MFFGSQRHCARGFFSWKEEGDPPKWHWYVLFGICQRGNHKSLWLKPMPLRTSRGEARIPQISKTEYLQALDEAGFCAKSNCVAMTDAAPTFASTGHPGIVQHFSVNHSEKEFSRAVEVVYKGEIRPAICHTQTIDRAWRSLKENLPAHTSARSEEKKVTLEIYIRSQQWQMFHSGEDRWRAFCIAVEQFKSYLAQVPDNAEEVPQAAVELCRRDLRNPLGAKDDRVPDAVHDRMNSLCLQGVIPRTTLAMRQRARKSPGTTYGVPHFLSEARDFDYISPNFEAPRGFRWTPKSDNTWHLEVKGG